MARRNTIANKWFLKSFSAVLIVLVLLDIVLYFVFRSYYYSSVESTLRGEVNVISTVLTRYYTGSGGSATYSAEIRRTIEGFNKKDRMELMMINEEGRVTITSSGFAPATVYEMPDYEAALTSENGTGSYNGYQPNGEKVMAVTVLLDIEDDNYCAVRVISSLSKVDMQLGMTMLFIVAVSGGVILLMLTLGLYFIKSIVHPLRQISNNAQKIARGDFSVHIEEKSDDELGELCHVFNYMVSELKNSESIKNDFISSVSHELRTPLTAIKGWSETVAENLDDKETAKKGMHVISEETGRLSQMVEELLDFSRMQGGRFYLNKENMDLFAELTDAVIIYSEKARLENKTILYDEPQAVVTIYGDRNRIRQVFINIIDNAIKYSSAGGQIAISVILDKDEVTIAVEDDGCGIAESDLAKIKTKFYKANNTVRGSGIGLAVAEEIITSHNGTLEIKSELGKYTRAEITLPIVV
ncbi:MAG: HAMP domain-containing histidine kinase [Ruminococcaceae bacterium]|nr:HAMP domain-containing histidine kinase [Oscillospiraceae bacterium]